MKMALVFDQLCGLGGTERVAQYVCEEFAEADVYSLAYSPEETFPYFKSREIRTTWLNRFVRSRTSFRWSFPIATYVMERLELARYDVVLSCSATVAKYVRVRKGKHICYCYIPTRALWHFDEYFRQSVLHGLLRPTLWFLRSRDLKAAARIDKFVAISELSREYIRKYYARPAEVIYCPVDLTKFSCGSDRKEHYLIVSRLEGWKRTDYAIEAFNRLGAPLRVIGSGPEEARLRALAGTNIEFLGSVDDDRLAREYSEARAVIFTPFLEYGLTPLEANACGTPVICYGRGGVSETMIAVNGKANSAEPATAIFFYDQTADALIRAIREFEKSNFTRESLVRHASQWGVPEFKKKMRNAILSLTKAGS